MWTAPTWISQCGPTNGGNAAGEFGGNGDPAGLVTGKVYSVWIDVVNNASTPIVGGVVTNADVYSVWLKRQDWPNRTNLISFFYSDRNAGDAAFSESLDRVFLNSNDQVTPQGFNMVRFDDFYISTNGFRTDEPVSAGNFVAP